MPYFQAIVHHMFHINFNFLLFSINVDNLQGNSCEIDDYGEAV